MGMNVDDSFLAPFLLLLVGVVIVVAASEAFLSLIRLQQKEKPPTLLRGIRDLTKLIRCSSYNFQIVKFDKKLSGEIEAYINSRRNPSAQKTSMVGTIRVDLKHKEHLNFQGFAKEGGSFTLEIDEPPERGGHGRGPTPLNYFLLGIGSCLLMQWAKLSILENLGIDALEATVRGHIDRRIDGSFNDIIVDIRIRGRSEEAEKIRRVAKDCERLCFVHNTLRRALPLTTNIELNGQAVYKSTVGPEIAGATSPSSTFAQSTKA
jgi:uncharacterized OsmC-like protein